MTKDDNQRIKRLELTIEEQRRDYDCLNGLYEHVKLKNFTFLAASLALLGYLYTSDGKPNANLKDKLFIPDEPYGVIVYAFGLFFLLSAITALMVAVIKQRTWSTSYDANLDKLAPDNYEEYLSYIKVRYDTIMGTNVKTYNGKQKLLNMSFIPLVLGGIILLLLKTFGG